MKFRTILGLHLKIVNYRSTLLSPASYLDVKISVNSKNSSLVPGLPIATFMAHALAALRARAPCPSGMQVNIIQILKVSVVIMFVSLKRNF